jgi:hypothetical protein
VGVGEGIGVGLAVGVGDGVGDGVAVGDELGVGLTVGVGAVVGAGAPPPDPGRIASRETATTSTAASAMKDGPALRTVGRVTIRVAMRRSSIAAAGSASEVRPSDGYDV